MTFVGEVIGPTHVHWTAVPNVDPTTGQVHPPLRRYESLVFDSRHFGVRMLGGWESDGPTSTWFADQYRWEPTPTGGSWQLVSPVTTTPTPRVYTDMAFDAPSGRMVMCAGRGPFSLQNDTWTFDGKTWTDHGPSSNVTPRMQPAIAHAPSLGTVLFGGGTGTGTYFADTWFWAGADWLPSLLSGAPPARMGHDMVFDSVRNEIVLHGGYDGATLADTWVLRPSSTFGTQWLPLTTIGTPPIPRQSHAMAFDARRGCVVVFGGANQHGQFLGDTWELVRGFLGAQWVQRVLSPSPPARWAHKMDYDPARGVVVMTGGYGNPQCGNYCASHLNDVWEYDGNSWQQRSPSTTLPTGREGAAFAYDSQRQRFVLQCGSGNPMFPSATWYYTVR